MRLDQTIDGWSIPRTDRFELAPVVGDLCDNSRSISVLKITLGHGAREATTWQNSPLPRRT
jgi:hypothetical protein